MTSEEFNELIQTAGIDEFPQAVGNLSDKDRRSLSATAARLLADERKKERGDTWVGMSKRGAMARLAVLAVCPWTKAQQVRWRDFQFFHVARGVLGTSFRFDDERSNATTAAAVEVLIDRKPDWAEKWVERQLGDGWGGLPWEAVHALVAEGVCARPTHVDGYIRLLANQWKGLEFENDPGILDGDIWRVFEVETSVFNDFPDAKSIDKRAWAESPVDTSNESAWQGFWPRVLFHYATVGRIDRGRLLDATLQALWRDFKNPPKSGLVKFHDLLEPTADELAALQTKYIELLRNDHGPSVNLALQTIEALHKQGTVDFGAVLAQLPDVFHLSAKTQPVKAVRLIEKLAGKDADRAAQALPTVGAAFTHASPDVHEAAVKLLEKWKSRFDSVPFADLADSVELISPTLKGRLVDLISESSDVVETLESQAEERSADLEQRQSELLERIRALPAAVVERCGLAEAEKCLADLTLPPPFSPDPAFPVLTGAEAIEPIASLDDLIDELAHAMEIVESPEQVERILDGVIRFGGERLEPHFGRLEGVRKQLEAGERAAERGLAGQVDAVPAVRRLLRTWLKVTRQTGSIAGGGYQDPIVEYLLNGFESRCQELINRLANNQYGPMLSLPTHRGGWIDPRVFVQRLLELSEQNVAPGRMDVIHGLLRLAPDFREEASRDAVEIGEPWGRCVRYALGGDEAPAKADREAKAVWLAAGRARQPSGQLEELSILDLDVHWPDGVTPARFEIHFESGPPDRDSAWQSRRREPDYVSVQPDPAPTHPGFHFPTIALALTGGGTSRYWWLAEWLYEFLTTIWPGRPEACFAMGCNQLIQRIDQTVSVFEPNWRLLHPLLQPDRAWSPLACTALWMGLLGRDENARGLCLDALIEGAQDGRAHPQPLGDALCGIDQGGWMKLNRLATALQEAARTGPLAEWVLVEVLDRLIASWRDVGRDAHHVLTLHLQLLTNLQCAPSSAAKDVLSAVQGSGKSAKLARQIRTLEQVAGIQQREAVLQALEGRLRRAERVATGSGLI